MARMLSGWKRSQMTNIRLVQAQALPRLTTIDNLRPGRRKRVVVSTYQRDFDHFRRPGLFAPIPHRIHERGEGG